MFGLFKAKPQTYRLRNITLEEGDRIYFKGSTWWWTIYKIRGNKIKCGYGNWASGLSVFEVQDLEIVNVIQTSDLGDNYRYSLIDGSYQISGGLPRPQKKLQYFPEESKQPANIRKFRTYDKPLRQYETFEEASLCSDESLEDLEYFKARFLVAFESHYEGVVRQINKNKKV